MTTKNRGSILVLVGWLGVLTAAPVRAQTNFQPGYVLPLAGDTLRGEVDARDGRASAERCRFRASPQAEAVPYLPAMLRGYGLPAEGKHYRALAVPTAPGAAPQPYFLEVLADGPAALYFLRDGQQHEFYYVASPQLPLAELKHAVVRVVRDGRTYTEEQNPYRATLSSALAGCAPAQTLLPNLPFQESALRRVVALYNACQGQVAPAVRPGQAAARVTLGLVAGAALQQLYYSGIPYGPQSTTSVAHTGYAVGPTATFHLNRQSRKLSASVGLLYEPNKYDLLAHSDYVGQRGAELTRTHFDLAYLRLPLLFRYTYPRGRFAPLAEAGFTVAYAVKRDNTYNEVYAGGQAAPPRELLANSSFRPLELGLGAGLGLGTRAANGRALAVLARAEISNGFSDAIGIGTTVLRLYGLLSYDLTK